MVLFADDFGTFGLLAVFYGLVVEFEEGLLVLGTSEEIFVKVLGELFGVSGGNPRSVLLGAGALGLATLLALV